MARGSIWKEHFKSHLGKIFIISWDKIGSIEKYIFFSLLYPSWRIRTENSSRLTRVTSLSHDCARVCTHTHTHAEGRCMAVGCEERRGQGRVEDDSILGTAIRNARLPHNHVTLCILAPVSSTPLLFDSCDYFIIVINVFKMENAWRNFKITLERSNQRIVETSYIISCTMWIFLSISRKREMEMKFKSKKKKMYTIYKFKGIREFYTNL